MNNYKFTVLGAPFGKLNMQPCMRGGHASTFSPKKNTDYMDRVVFCFYESLSFDDKNDLSVDSTSAFAINITAYYPIPKSTSKKNKQLMILGELLPTKKPDLDNISKVILDALTLIHAHGLWEDDSQVVKESLSKIYSEQPRVVVEIQRLKNKE